MAHRSLTDGFYVYVHSRLTTGEPFYVGKGRYERAFEVTRRNTRWTRTVAKDGGRYCNFIAENVDDEFAMLLEIEAIDKYRRLGSSLANIKGGGDTPSGFKMTAEQRAKMSAWQKGKPKPKLSEERKSKIRASCTGKKYPNRKPHSEERKAKIGAFHKGKQHTLGHKLTEEHKAKVNAARAAWPKEKKDEIYKRIRASCKAFYERRRAEK